jgi:single-stranded-DNA-specific exonuclease
MAAILSRPFSPAVAERLAREGVPPLLARLYAARGIAAAHEAALELSALAPPGAMLNLEAMARRLAEAIEQGRRLLVVADYDADGATACAVGVRALRAFGAKVDYLVPNRFEHGYGLTPSIVRLARERARPDVLITVDNGIASLEGVAEANRLGIEVLITDHHLPGEELPAAACIVNPNQPGCTFPSKHLAGVGVMFYLALAMRAELRRRGAAQAAGVSLADLLPLVALGTIADVVPLDRNNRILVHHGLERIRRGRMPPGIAALFEVARRDPLRASVRDLGYALGPRLNAAGRLTDMALGIECLLADDAARASTLALELDRLNRDRQAIESGMQEEALAALEARDFGDSFSICVYDPGWHPGVVGLVAGRLRERFHRPALAFARAGAGEIRGSGRSIPALHLRDALQRVAVRYPGLVLKFGGHAAAAGLTLRESDFERFADAFEEAARALLSPADLQRVFETDGSLAPHELTLESARLLENGVWGPGFPPPSFHDEFEVVGQRVVAERHLRLRLRCRGRPLEAMLFGSTGPLPPRIEAVHRLEADEYEGLHAVRLNLIHWRGLSERGAPRV